jgi:hypothetical protein
MTQEQLEAAGVAFLAALLSANSDLSGIDYAGPVPSRSQETPPEDRSQIVVLCSEVQNFREITVDAMLDCFVRSPADIEDVTLDTHSALTKALQEAWASANYGAWSTAVAGVDADWTGANFYREGWSGGSQGTEWLPSLRIKVGAKTA